MQHPRYRFAHFTVSPARRQLLHEGREVALIPRYFDLLLLLLARRHEAVPRLELLDTVWDDVIVTDNALNQAVRVLRRALGDDSRSPSFIRTSARHGYQFIYPDVVEESDSGPVGTPASREEGAAATRPGGPEGGPQKEAALEQAVDQLLQTGQAGAKAEALLEAAEELHALGTREALRRIEGRPGEARARALLREARWEVSGAGDVPLLGQPEMWKTGRLLATLRLATLFRPARRRLLAAASGAGLSGVLAGLVGGVVLRFGPDSSAGNAVLIALPLVGLALGGAGGAGVGAGITACEVVFRSFRRLALVVGGMLGGGSVGALGHGLAAALLASLFGSHLSPLAGGLEGLVVGGAAAFGYASSTPAGGGGLTTPRGRARCRTILGTGLACGLGAGLLGWRGSHLGAMSLDLMASSFPNAQVSLEPLARLLQEPEPGVTTRVCVSAWEGLMFGAGLALGLTHRPRRPQA